MSVLGTPHFELSDLSLHVMRGLKKHVDCRSAEYEAISQTPPRPALGERIVQRAKAFRTFPLI